MPIRVEGIDDIVIALDFEKSVDKLTQEILLSAGNLLIKLIQEKAPRKTGQYSESWVIQKASAESITIGTSQEKLFIFLEYGTSAHKITPKKKSVLRWEDSSGVHFAMFVNHTGFPAKPHLRPAMKRFERQLPILVEEKVKKHWKVK